MVRLLLATNGDIGGTEMPEEHMREELTEDIFNQCKDLQIRYCDCAAIAKKLIELGWEKKGDDNGSTL